MKDDTRYPWPGSNDVQVVTEMLQNLTSPHWKECHLFVSRLVDKANVPEDLKEEIIQETMIAVSKGLGGFHHKCKLTTWLATITTNKKIDTLRKHGHDRETSLTNLQQPHDEAEPFELMGPRTTEEECIIREELREVISELQRLTKHRFNSDRDRTIIYKVLLEQYSREEVAKEFGVDYQAVCYIISRAQKHLRSVFKHIPPI